MSLRYFIHILFKRKWFILIALLLAPLAAGVILLFVEPVYVSNCKLEIHDRSNESDPLKTAKSNIKDDVFISAQVELIYTDRVMGKVIDKAGLIPEGPSQSIYARWSGQKTFESKYDPVRERIEIIRGLRNKHVKVDRMSPVVMSITSQMNTPELAQKVTRAVLDSFKEEFERMQSTDVQFEKLYVQRIKALDELIEECQKEMEEFNKLHPRDMAGGKDPLILPIPDQAGKISIIPNVAADKIPPNEMYVKRMAEISPVQSIMNEIARLEIEAINIEAQSGKDSYKYKVNQEKIAKNQSLLEEKKKELSEQEVLAVKYSALVWKLEDRRQTRKLINDEYQRAKGENERKMSTTANINIQDDPTVDPQPIFPKKAMVLIAATFIGLVLGLALAYLAHVLDTTYHLPEDFAADKGIQVLATIPIQQF